MFSKASILSPSEWPFLWNRFKKKYHWLIRGVGLIALYALWLVFFRLVALSFIAFFLIPSSTITSLFNGTQDLHAQLLPRFEEVNEVLGANELSLVGLSAFIFVLFIRLFRPFSQHDAKAAPIQTIPLLKQLQSSFLKRFWPGALHGSVLAFGVTIAFLLSGLYRFLGIVFQFEDTTFAIPNLILRISAIGLFVYSEEYLFRNRITDYLSEGLTPAYIDPQDIEKEKRKSQILAALFTALLYCLVKTIQFDLGWMHLVTLFLISIALTLRSHLESDFVHSAGFWSAMLVVFHAGFSLPIFGNEFSGLLLFKYQSSITEVANQTETSRFLTGGAGGPLSGLAFQILLIIDIGRNGFKYFGKKLF